MNSKNESSLSVHHLSKPAWMVDFSTQFSGTWHLRALINLAFMTTRHLKYCVWHILFKHWLFCEVCVTSFFFFIIGSFHIKYEPCVCVWCVLQYSCHYHFSLQTHSETYSTMNLSNMCKLGRVSYVFKPTESTSTCHYLQKYEVCQQCSFYENANKV